MARAAAAKKSAPFEPLAEHVPFVAPLDLGEPFVIDRRAFAPDAEAEGLRTDLRVPFGDGVYRFHLNAHQSFVLENGLGVPAPYPACYIGKRFYKIGLGGLYARMCRGRLLFPNGSPIWSGVAQNDPAEAAFYFEDISAVILHALIGGGDVDAAAAADLVARYVDNAPIGPNWLLAFSILGCRLFGRQPDASDK